MPANTMGIPLAVFGSLLWLLVASPTLVESDTYRYASAILAIIALIHYLRMPERPRTNWLGWLCMGWGLYVAVRYIAIYIVTPAHDLGASDWLYAFPLFFPILGIAFALYAVQMEKIIAAFFAAALTMFIVTEHFQQIFAGETIRPLIMNNQIHGAVASGIILICTLFWLLHYLTDGRSRRAFARFAFVVAPLVIVLCLIGIYGAKSKGVWMALGITLPVLALVALRYLKPKIGSIIIVCAAVMLLAGMYMVRDNLYKTAGPTVNSAVAMIQDVTEGHDLNGVVSGTIDSDSTPVSMDERLQLWSNGWEVFSSAPVFGWGNQWLERWHQTRYAHVHYTLLHNGYLEMLVRYGLFGAVVMSAILVSLIVSVWRACSAGIIPRAAFHTYMVVLFFFALTLLSNSNNRLAIGESLALGSSAFACWCNMRLSAKRDMAQELSSHASMVKE